MNTILREIEAYSNGIILKLSIITLSIILKMPHHVSYLKSITYGSVCLWFGQSLFENVIVCKHCYRHCKKYALNCRTNITWYINTLLWQSQQYRVELSIVRYLKYFETKSSKTKVRWAQSTKRKHGTSCHHVRKTTTKTSMKNWYKNHNCNPMCPSAISLKGLSNWFTD